MRQALVLIVLALLGVTLFAAGSATGSPPLLAGTWTQAADFYPCDGSEQPPQLAHCTRTTEVVTASCGAELSTIDISRIGYVGGPNYAGGTYTGDDPRRDRGAGRAGKARLPALRVQRAACRLERLPGRPNHRLGGHLHDHFRRDHDHGLEVARQRPGQHGRVPQVRRQPAAGRPADRRLRLHPRGRMAALQRRHQRRRRDRARRGRRRGVSRRFVQQVLPADPDRCHDGDGPPADALRNEAPGHRDDDERADHPWRHGHPRTGRHARLHERHRRHRERHGNRADGCRGAPARYLVGTPPMFYDIKLTGGTSTGTITVCVPYGEGLSGNTPLLLHFEGGAWKPVTTTTDPVTHTICGEVTSLSPFATVFAPAAPQTTADCKNGGGRRTSTRRSRTRATASAGSPRRARRSRRARHVRAGSRCERRPAGVPSLQWRTARTGRSTLRSSPRRSRTRRSPYRSSTSTATTWR